MTRRVFPDGFLWGTATAGHQIEGGSDNSDLWFLEQQDPTVFRAPSGLACNSWELWAEDLQLVADLGLNAYRFSVEWARIEPSPGEYSSAALDRYAAMVERCHELGLAPVVTFNHFVTPHWFAKRGGFLADGAAEVFAAYCSQVMAAFGDRIAYAITLNEPNLYRMLDWIGLPDFVRDLERATLEAAARSAGVDRYRVNNVVLPEDYDPLEAALAEAHQVAKTAIKAARPDLPVGLSIAIIDAQVTGDDTSVRDRHRAEVYDRWLDVAAADDFLGVQNYERRWYDGDGEVKPDVAAPKNDLGSIIDPASLAGAVRYSHERSGVPIMVTEHGVSTDDDTARAAFIPPSLVGLHEAIDDGVPVLGYLHWSLLDNFEWIFGYDHHLGLVEVDLDTFERTPKPSAGVYAAIARSGAVDG